MLILIMGQNSSGKSAWAEKLAVQLQQGRLIYIATMIPDGEEGRARVARHREARQHSGFITMEIPWRLADADVLARDTVLLEDVANLTANMIFAAAAPADTRAVLDNIQTLTGRCQALLAVSIAGIEPLATYDAPTLHFIEVLKKVNDGLFTMADTVYEMADGRPLLRKGAKPCRC